MNVELLFPSKYIKAADLQGKDHEVEIERFVPEDLQLVGGKKQRKGVIYFKGKQKAMVLSAKINKQVLVHNFGTETDDWVGQKIRIYPSKDTFMGKFVDCLRVRCDAENPMAMREFTSGNANYMRDLEEWLQRQDSEAAQ